MVTCTGFFFFPEQATQCKDVCTNKKRRERVHDGMVEFFWHLRHNAGFAVFPFLILKLHVCTRPRTSIKQPGSIRSVAEDDTVHFPCLDLQAL